MFFYSINSVDLKIMATSAQLYVTKFYLPWPLAVQLCHAQRNFQFHKTETWRYFHGQLWCTHGLLPQPKWFTGSPTNCKQQCLNQIRQAFINVPEKGEKIFFAWKHIVQRDVCFENFGKPEQICKFPGIIGLHIQ